MTPSLRILIVEDNPDDEALLMRQLKKAELAEHVKTIHDGKKALDYLIEAQNLAAVFLDLKLPRLSGLKVLEAMRANERTANIPVIVMTSSNAPEELEVCRKLGVASFVPKPLTFTSFAKAFADNFQTRRSVSTS
jgi:two-component system response regulator